MSCVRSRELLKSIAVADFKAKIRMTAQATHMHVNIFCTCNSEIYWYFCYLVNSWFMEFFAGSV